MNHFELAFILMFLGYILSLSYRHFYYVNIRLFRCIFISVQLGIVLYELKPALFQLVDKATFVIFIIFFKYFFSSTYTLLYFTFISINKNNSSSFSFS